MQKMAQKALGEVQFYAARWKQTIHHSKTEWQWIYRRVRMPTSTLTVDKHTVRRTSSFKYLGNYVDER